jgi:cytochrome c-type biogenesis protein CcmE
MSLFLGAWGAGLSTALFVRQVRSDRRLVLVRASIGHRSGSDGKRHRVLVVWISNQGKRAVEIRSIAFELTDERFAVFDTVEGDQLPARLNDGDGLTLHFSLGQFKRSFQTERAQSIVVTDASGATHRCPVPDEVNEALGICPWSL